ncbi:RecX family transcriptional regulator [Providencia rettgeri]|uniref:RecX family transcriptional regulator n=1 Tax=Providencia TaxID=586 RepID=UPI00226F7228|nr:MULTISPECIES: RecX family transcriptional regulator [Providencia]MCL0017366.1 RecX family transcriptional regulator [Providencia rettgeri]MCX9125492.1 RecX family transcriptional regulator [Providencia rettgeri]MCX9130097.1 RecX family transcriptional regulator [Providencia rettgeri]
MKKNEGIIDEPLIELVLERLSEQYFHDDDRIAGLLMQDYFRKGYELLRIKQEMRQKSFTETVVEKYFATLDED